MSEIERKTEWQVATVNMGHHWRAGPTYPTPEQAYAALRDLHVKTQQLTRAVVVKVTTVVEDLPDGT